MIGCGEIAVRTAAGIAASRHARHVMVMDVNAGIAEDLGTTYGVPWTTDVKVLLANPAVDAVYIAVPHSLHAPLAMQALEAGKHVLVEKPIATTLEDTAAMIAAGQRANRILSVAFDAQVNPESQHLRQLIANGAIGTVTGTRIVYRSDKPASYWQSGFTGRVQTDWRGSKRTAGGGVLVMNTIHDLNTIRYITGLEVTRIAAEIDTFATPVEVEDYVSATYRYDNGAIGSLEAGSALAGKDPSGERNRIYGDTGQILLTSPVRIFQRGTNGTGEWRDLPPREETREQGRARIVDGFATAVLTGTTPPVTGADGWAALATALAAYQAAEEQRSIEVPAPPA
jgi:predicted dehydrogenase